MIRVSILGATGYSGGELLQLLLSHPGVVIKHVTSRSSVGKAVSDIHPSLVKRSSLKFEKFDPSVVANDSDVIFSCLPATMGLKSTAQLVKQGKKVIDLSADFRFPTAALFQTWYKEKHGAPHLLKSRVYGLPELFRNQIQQSTLVANPGCYATAAILAAAPLIKPLIVDPHSLIVDAKSGVSGAGKKVDFQMTFCEVNESVKPYNVGSHRHQPEIESVLDSVGSSSVKVTFTPHLIPMNRGLLTVLYATLKKAIGIKDLRSLFIKAYEQEPFVRVLPEGVVPQTKHVRHTNYCDIGIFQDDRMRRAIIVAAIDNLGKGAAGQAVQNMNLLFGRSETEGLQV
ncbi:N-acetyl-gamma-glutamyl-phosphate reductase [bacterium F11]|nr:N-acetyl-gamma-glutamyl-phosphate reductase [bacterium F11]